VGVGGGGGLMICRVGGVCFFFEMREVGGVFVKKPPPRSDAFPFPRGAFHDPPSVLGRWDLVSLSCARVSVPAKREVVSGVRRVPCASFFSGHDEIDDPLDSFLYSI